MQPASAKPDLRSSRPGPDRIVAIGLIRNFLAALESEGGAKTPCMRYAQRAAERQLALWGQPVAHSLGDVA